MYFLVALFCMCRFGILRENNYLLNYAFFIPSSYRPGKKSSPKWFNSQCAKAVKHKNHRFKQWIHQTPHSRALFVQARNLCSKTITHAKTSFVNRVNNKIALCHTGSRSFWSLAKVVFPFFFSTSKNQLWFIFMHSFL